MRHTETLKVPKNLADKMEEFCKSPPGDCGRGEAVFDEEVAFPNGNRVVIQVIASEEPDTESCWTQGVLFSPNGCEMGCTAVGETFGGEYYIPDGDDEYVVMVVPTALKGFYPEGICPDCREDIPDTAEEGEACQNCGHVFWYPRKDD